MSRNRQKYKTSKLSFPLVDVCVMTAGCVDMFEKCIAAIMPQILGIDSRIYVLNNGAPSEKYDEIYETLPKNAQVIRLYENVGFPAGANKLFKRGLAPLILFVSDDVILKDGAVEALLRRMDDPKIGLCGMKLLFPEDATNRPAGKVQHVGHGFDIHANIIHPLIGWSADNPKCCISREVLSVTGAAFIVRRKAFMEAGGFFEGYGRGYYEDSDLCLTLRKLGYKIYIDTDAIGYHYVGATMEFLKAKNPMIYNQTLFMQRHMRDLAWDSWTYW